MLKFFLYTKTPCVIKKHKKKRKKVVKEVARFFIVFLAYAKLLSLCFDRVVNRKKLNAAKLAQ